MEGERKFGLEITLVGKGSVVARRRGVEITFGEEAAPRKKGEQNKPKFPRGTIESLMPLLREAYLDFGITGEESYWARLTDEAVFPFDTACAKLRSAGVGSMTVAEAMLARDESLNRAIGFRQITSEQVEALKRVVADKVLEHYNPQPTSLR